MMLAGGGADAVLNRTGHACAMRTYNFRSDSEYCTRRIPTSLLPVAALDYLSRGELGWQLLLSYGGGCNPLLVYKFNKISG